MKTYRMREAKSHLSEIARAAARGERSIITDNRKPVAMVGPLPAEAPEFVSQPVEKGNARSGAAEFRQALFSVPHPLEIDF